MSAKYPRTGKYIVPAGRCWSPSSLVTVVCATRPIGLDAMSRLPASELARVHVAESHKRAGVWTGVLYRSFDTGEEFHDWLEAYASRRRQTYIMTEHVGRTMILTDWWARIEARGCLLVRSLAAEPGGDPSPPVRVEVPESGTPDKSPRAVIDPGLCRVRTYIDSVQTCILRYAVQERSFQWTNFGQYLEEPEDTVAKAIGFRWRTNDGNHPDQVQQLRHPADRAHMWLDWFRQLSDWWLSSQGGPWAATTAGLAWSYLRRRLQPRTVLHHDDERAGVLENQALHGGRRSVWFFGDVGTEQQWAAASINPPHRSERATIHEPIDQWDVQSMYPFLLRTMPFPVERIAYHRRISPAYIAGLCSSMGMIARVVIRTLTPEYPADRGHGAYYPIGTFTTTLAGPELQLACALGDVIHVHAAARYKMAYPFRVAIDPLIRLRSEYGEASQKGWSKFFKAMMVKMGGRLAPHKYHWMPRPSTPAIKTWGPWTKRDFRTEEVRTYMARAGMTWERVEATEYIRPMGAAYAYLTAYGRSMMRMLRSTIDRKAILAQDTDGLWCTASARLTLDAFARPEHPDAGDLTWRRECRAARFWGPQHYWTDAGWVLSGMSRPEYDRSTCSISGTLDLKGQDRTTSTPRPLLLHQTYSVPLVERIGPGTVDEQGWYHPPIVHVDAG